MTFSRVKPGGWTIKEALQPAEITQLDINVSNSFDKRLGATETIESNVIYNADVSFSSTSSLTTDADTEVTLTLGNADANILLKDGAGVALENGGYISLNDASIALNNGSYLDVQSSSAIRCLTSGAITVSNAGGIVTSTPGGIKLSGGSTDWIVLNNARTLKRSFVPQSGILDYNGDANGWICDDYGQLSYQDSDKTCCVPIDFSEIHNQGTFSKFNIRYSCASAFSVGFPASVELVRRTFTGSQTTLATANFSDASLFPTIQTLAITVSTVIDTTQYTYFLRLISPAYTGKVTVYNMQYEVSNITKIGY